MNMFVDQIKIEVHAGKGGDGMVAFRREKYVPNGGPAGGDGGRGGSIILKVDEGLRTLMDFRYHRIFKAKNGGNGMSKQMTGPSAEDTIIAVPQGTTVRDLDTGEIIGDLVEKDQELVVAKGGRGGRGNIHFASAKNPAPEIAENGEPGEDHYLELELKMLADVGLIGFPSVGKSTLLSVVTGAKPKIAAYEFTTLTPNLGMVMLPDGRDFAMADMPGLIEGAGDGKGLGHEFLRHIKRCRVLIHVIDMSGFENDPIEAYNIINAELAKYDLDLEKKKQIVVANKMDEDTAKENLERFKKEFPNLKVYETITFMHEGIDEVLYATMDAIEEARKKEALNAQEKEEVVVYRYEPKRPDFVIVNLGNHRWKIDSDKIDRLAEQVDFDKEDDTYQFAATLKKMGVDKALYEKGARDGDQVIVGTFIMDYSE